MADDVDEAEYFIPPRRKKCRHFCAALSLQVVLFVIGIAFVYFSYQLNFKISGKGSSFTRLPTSVKPINYKLQFHLDSKTSDTFDGVSEIKVSVVEATDTITVNAAELNITSVSFQPANSGSLFGEISLNVKEELATFSFGGDLPLGNGLLLLKFRGYFNAKGKGIFRTKYTTPSGNQAAYGAATHFEATEARRAFPCWDEPAIKATFDISITAPKDKTVLSNMPLKKQTILNNFTVVAFERTPLMSTYLVAFATGEFDFIEATDENGALVRVYTPVGRKEQGQFALSIATKALLFYEDYFNIGYPLPKIDLIYIPNKQGAMENWGLLAFDENALLVDPLESSAVSKQVVAITVCHELAHQWFGNLVTIDWWTHLWLKEGYATWISYLCVDHLFPTWNIWSRFLSSDFSTALNLDSLRNSHPVELSIDNPGEIQAIFDGISYSKGAAIIRMIHDFIGDEAFRKGMNIYLSRHQYNSTETQDLWRALGEASGKDVGGIMSAFTSKTGYPLLSVETRDGALVLKQEKFNADGKHTPLTWPIPVTSIRQGEVLRNEFVFDKQLTQLIAPKSGEWIKFNAGMVGFYRVHYSQDLLAELSNGIRFGSLSNPADRLGLVADQLALCRAGYGVTIPQLLEFFKNFENETNLAVWQGISEAHSAVALLMQYTTHGESFEASTRKLFGKVAKRLGWDAKPREMPNDALLRSLVISKMGFAGDSLTISESRRRFDEHVAKRSLLPPDLRFPVYSIIAHYGDEQTYQQMYQLFKETNLKEEKSRLFVALGLHNDLNLKKKFLEWCMSDEVRSSVGPASGFAAASNSPDGREMVWNFARSNWKILLERYSNTMFYFSAILHSIASGFHDAKHADAFDAFFAASLADGNDDDDVASSANRVASQISERIRIQAAWLRREQPELLNYFS